MDPNEMHIAAYRRHLRAKNRSARTIEGYEFSIIKLADHAGRDVLDLTRDDINAYLAGLLDSGAAATSVGVHFRSLRAFYNWAVAEEIIERSPMRGLTAPTVTDKPPSVIPDGNLRALLKACAGSDFEARRDTAMIRLWCEPGSPRVSEMAGMTMESLDLNHDQVTVHGKGDKVRTVPFGAKTGQAIDRYLRVRAKHPLAKLPALWLGGRDMGLTRSGMQQMLRRRAQQAGIGHIHPHQLRHTAAHNWADSDGSDQDAMQLFGWTSPEMPRLYGRSASAERARRAARRRSLGDRI